ncbi:MAG: hypothetical protein ACI3ZK_07330 [Candidatus Cryptobacteroides sp.]
MKKFLTLFMAILFNCVMGAFCAGAMGFSPVAGAIGANAIASIPSLFSSAPAAGGGILNAGVLREVWTGEMVKALRGGLKATWLDGIPDATSAVDNDVIHLVDVGVDPDVLINNTTYPIELQQLDDNDISISLDKFQTKVTPITDDELFALSYDKMSRVIESHRNSIDDAKFKKAAHALCAASNTAKTPVLATTGARDASTGRLAMTRKDLIAMKEAMDKLGVPAENRRLVLCPSHVNDILGWSEEFTRQYNMDNINGRVGRLYGFDIYESAYNPFYTSNGNKKALGTTPGAGEFQASFAFYTKRVFKATGSTKMYYSRAETDPEFQRNKINFRHYFIAMPKKADAGVVLRSAYAAE